MLGIYPLVVILFFAIVVTPKWVPTPTGIQWDECIVKVQSGSQIFDKGEEVIVVSPSGEFKSFGRCERPERHTSEQKTRKVITEGWQSWASYATPENQTFTSFLGYFNTPSPPPSWPNLDDAILYLFTGLQNYNWIPDYQPRPPPSPSQFDIIQPVIQYGGGSENGGGKYWGVASWYVTTDLTRSFWSDLIELSPGDEIFGNMTMIGDDTWYIGATTPSGNVTSLSITKSRLVSQPWAYVTLEVYNIQDCSWFPENTSENTVQFTQLVLQNANGNVTPTWQTFNGKNTCNTSIEVLSPSEINIIW